MHRSGRRAVLTGLFTLGCGTGSAPSTPALSPGASAVELRRGLDHPRLALVARDGDPSGAVAVAVAHDLGGQASAWLAALAAGRLGATASSSVNGAGFVLRRRVASGEEAAQAVRALTASLTTPVVASEFARLGETPPPGARRWAGPADQALGECSAELGAVDPKRPTLAQLEKWREATLSDRGVAFAAVGPRPILDSVDGALAGTPAWPSSGKLADPWPEGGRFASELAASADGALAVAVRIADPARAIEAADALARPDGDFALHARALEPSLRVASVVAVTRPRGACLRVELVPEEPLVDPRAAAAAAALSLQEIGRAVGRAPGGRLTVTEQVLDAADPVNAATVAAWNALAGQLEGGPAREFAGFATREPGRGDFAKAIADERALLARPAVELVTTLESGQGELWALAASPCATASESTTNAGAAALSVRVLAAAARIPGAKVEPWISAEGIGLLVHGSRLTPSESAAAHAARLGDALGRALVTTELRDDVAARVRAAAVAELVPELEPHWATVLGALSPGRPSLLDPRGTWQSLAEFPLHSLDRERRALVRGPMRLAVLAVASRDQAASVRDGFERWLRPQHSDTARCPQEPGPSARPGLYELPGAKSEAPGSYGLVAVPVRPSPVGGLPREAEWTARALGGPGGLLDRAVTLPGVAAHAEARVIGGSSGGALLVEIAAPDRKAQAATEQVRALFERLSQGAITQADAGPSRAALEAERSAALVDPRQRLVSSWRGRTEQPLPDLASLRRFQQETLAPDRHVVVVTKARP